MEPDPLASMAVGALLVGGGLALPLFWKIRAARASARAEREARFEAALSRARASFGDVMNEVIALEERDPETGAEARLTVAVLAKKIEEIQRDLARNPKTRENPLVVERLDTITSEIERITSELGGARPKKSLPILSS